VSWALDFGNRSREANRLFRRVLAKPIGWCGAVDFFVLSRSSTELKLTHLSISASGSGKEENAILGSPISRLTRLWFKPLGFASVGTGLAPLHEKGLLSWDDVSLAPGWYQSAPLALDCGFQVNPTLSPFIP
jgi:hypothetical protein